MAEVLAIILAIVILILISISWTNGIDKSIKYEKENPNADPDAGWLNWDKQSTKTK
jgi:hypothetical protein